MDKASPQNYWHYNKKLQPLASKLRKTMTKAEACLWKYALKAGKMSHWQFRRQRPVLNYIADFMCKELMLVIEVDGISHQWEATTQKDELKQKDLEMAGFKVLRFSDGEVLNDIANVIRVIDYWSEIKQKEYEVPPPNPRQREKSSVIHP